MQNSSNLTFTSATRPFQMLLKCAGCVVFGLFLISCSSIPSARREITMSDETPQPIRYSMIFIIHGDGDYLYHDAGGQAHLADKAALAGAIEVAEQNRRAEVFIFHQKPRRHAWLFFPRHDGTCYHYREGRLLAKESYWRNRGKTRFQPEVELYSRYHPGASPPEPKLLLYFGHQIPEFGGAGYDASSPGRVFTIDDFAGGLKQIKSDSVKLDLIVLSTCYNGTPYTVAALAPYARYIIASPGNLHRSYFDLQRLENLDRELQDGDMAALAKNFARQAFDKLTEDIQTAVTVAVYDVDSVRGYLNSVGSAYEQTLTALSGKKPGSVEHLDCAEDPAYARPGMSEGVDIFYRPPRFGRLKNKQSHSGWGCWSLPRQSP
jgi:hypothetical protein